MTKQGNEWPSSTNEANKAYGVSVIVCTRNRGESITDTISTILANTHPSFELIIIDQSTDDKTGQTVAHFEKDPRLRYLHSKTKGLSKARNIGWKMARSEIILMTDDDCDIPPNWIAQMDSLFKQHPQVGCIFCDVDEGSHDKTKGFIPFHIHEKEMFVRKIKDYKPGAGMGAGMGLRRCAIEKVNGFDEQLGAGVDLASAEDLDMSLRLVLNGYHIYHTKSVTVIHHGFRTYAQARHLIRGYIYGQSAMYTKFLRCGYWSTLTLYIKSIHMNITGVIILCLKERKIPRVAGRIIYLFKGFIQGWKLPINRTSGLFQESDPRDRAD